MGIRDRVATVDEVINLSWEAVGAAKSYAELGAVLDQVDSSPTLEGTESLYLLRGHIRQRRSELTLSSDAYAEGHVLFPDNNLFPYEAGLLALDGNYYTRAQQMMQTLGGRLETLTDRQCRGLWRGGALAGLHGTARLAFDRAQSNGSELATPEVSTRLDRAIEIQRAMISHPVRVVSLGNNCFPWMVLNRWGLRPDPADPRDDCVFNLAQCSGYTAAAVVRAPQDLIRREDLEAVSPEGTPLPWHTRFGMLFNHEGGDLWIADDFAKLLERYRPRIENLVDSFSGDPRVFVYYVEGAVDLDDLVDAVSTANTDENYSLVIVDTRADRQPPARHDRLRYLPLDLPVPEYVWHVPDQFDSVHGVTFESAVAEAVLEEAQKLSAAPRG